MIRLLKVTIKPLDNQCRVVNVRVGHEDDESRSRNDNVERAIAF